MLGSKFQIAAAAVAVSLLMSSAASATETTTPPVAPAAIQPGASWLTLSMLTPAGSIGLAGAAVQPPQTTPGDYAPPPQAGGKVPTPPIPVIAIWLAEIAVAIYILTRHHHGRITVPNTDP